jgi:hypothetical protein
MTILKRIVIPINRVYLVYPLMRSYMVYLVGVFMGITIPTYGGYYNSYTHKNPNCTPMASDWPAFMGAKFLQARDHQVVFPNAKLLYKSNKYMLFAYSMSMYNYVYLS